MSARKDGGYYHDDGKKVLVMIGEEIHNQDRQPQKSHLLVFGADRDLASLAKIPRNFIKKSMKQAGSVFWRIRTTLPCRLFVRTIFPGMIGM